MVQNLETAVRKNIEIQQVGSNFFSTLFNLGQFSGEQQHHQNNQVQKREVGEDTGVGSINLFTFSNQEIALSQEVETLYLTAGIIISIAKRCS